MKMLFAAILLISFQAWSKSDFVVMETNMGSIEMELFTEKAPLSVANFLQYVDNKFYDGTIFHRVIGSFMIQGGGFDEKFKQKTTKAEIKNEASNGLKNDEGTLAMARTGKPDSATSQFFINVVNNDGLNRPQPDGHGYAVFGKVTKGMHVVNRIKMIKTGFMHGMSDVPMDTVLIKSIRRKK